jgi:tetratricopeptide (TPR) repeat protein/predicted Ser/Thr protein kinase
VSDAHGKPDAWTGGEVSDEKLWSWVDRNAAELEAYLEANPHERGRVDEIRSAIGSVRSATEDTPPRIPEHIGSYRIIRLLGEGGMGRVYEAQQRAPRRIVALKVLKGSTLFNADRLRSFRRETDALARLRHPSIAPIYEAGRTDDGHYFFSMELVNGASLSEWVRADRPSRRRRLELFVRACDAVDHAHECDVIHRDLKPSNIVIDANGIPRVLDFGLARIIDPDATLISTRDGGQLGGTLPYMSPEQAMSDPDDLDRRCDVYSLGVILFQLLTDRLPFELTRTPLPEAVRIICERPPPRPSSLDRALRGDPETIVLRALRKDRAERYQTAGELGRDVERYLAGEPILAHRPGIGYLLRKRVVKHRRWIGLAAALGVLTLAGWYASERWRRAEHAGELARVRFEVLETQRRIEAGVPDPDLRPVLTAASEFPEVPEAPLVWLQARLRAAVASADEERIGAAIQTLRAESARTTGRWAQRFLLADIYTTIGEPEADEFRRQAETEFPGDADSWYVRSFASLDDSEALRCVKEAVLREPDDALLQQRLAHLSVLNADHAGARIAARRLIEIGEDKYTWMLFEGHTLMREGRYRDAIDQYTLVASATMPRPEAYLHRGSAYLCLQAYGGALQDLTRAVNLAGDEDPSAREQRATALWASGRPNEAAEEYRRLRRVLGHASRVDVRRHLALLDEGGRLESEGQPDRARAALAGARSALRSARLGAVPGSPFARIVACLGDGIGESRPTLAPERLVALAAGEGEQGRCVASFYAAEILRIAGDDAGAIELYQACLATGQVFVEDRVAPLPLPEFHLARWRIEQLTESQAEALTPVLDIDQTPTEAGA